MNELQNIRLITFAENGTLRLRQPQPGRTWYPDVDQLPELSRSCMLGAICGEPSAALATSAHVGIVWDLYLHAGKPDAMRSKEFWSNAQRSIHSNLGVTKDQWLHVTANNDEEIGILQELGVKAALIPRGDANAAMAAQLSNVPLLISDLTQLQYGVATAKSTPVCLRVVATATHKKVADEYLKWIRREHGPDLLQQNGCQEYRVLRLNAETLICEYIFTTRGLLDYYVEHHAPPLRARARELFPEHLLKFDRDVCTMEAFGAQRSARDFV